MAEGNGKFEEALAELEGLVQRLEKGELPLEESLAAFERGMTLVRQLGERLLEFAVALGHHSSSVPSTRARALPCAKRIDTVCPGASAPASRTTGPPGPPCRTIA